MGSFDNVKTEVVNGISLAYTERGDGAPLVFVHGSVSDLRTWETQQAFLGESFRAIAYSRRYARPNVDIEDGVDDQTMPHVEDLAAFLEAVGAKPAHLVGHSWGAFIALLAAMRDPALVDKLVLIEPPLISMFVDIPPRPHQLLKLLFTKPGLAGSIIKFAATTVGPAQKAYKRGDNDKATEIFGRGIFGPEAFEALGAERMQQVRENRRADKAQVTGAGFPSIDRREVAKVTAPTLLLHGEKSPLLFQRIQKELEAILPDARRTVITGASHLLHEQEPEIVAQMIRDFLGAAPSVTAVGHGAD